jgi:hypothetical protein
LQVYEKYEEGDSFTVSYKKTNPEIVSKSNSTNFINGVFASFVLLSFSMILFPIGHAWIGTLHIYHSLDPNNVNIIEILN